MAVKKFCDACGEQVEGRDNDHTFRDKVKVGAATVTIELEITAPGKEGAVCLGCAEKAVELYKEVR
jgi:hypothetical protein